LNAACFEDCSRLAPGAPDESAIRASIAARPPGVASSSRRNFSVADLRRADEDAGEALVDVDRARELHRPRRVACRGTDHRLESRAQLTRDILVLARPGGRRGLRLGLVAPSDGHARS
jgi:hypothetical protein